jgi:hypothetical protein
MDVREPVRALSHVRSHVSKSRIATVDRDDVALAAVFVTAIALIASILILAAPLGHLLPSGGFRFFPSVLHLVYPKPAEQIRYLLAIIFVLALGLVFAYGRVPRALRATQAGSTSVRLASVGAQLAIVGVAVWGWWAQFHYTDGEPSTTHFSNDNLIAAVAIASGLVLLVRLRPGWFDPRPVLAHRSRSWIWLAVAALLTVCWLLPSIFREQNLAPASLSVTYHLQFTFDDFAALVDGRTPLVNYADQYASLLPFVVWPAFRLGGTQVGAFTVTMCLLSLLSLLAVERVLALIARSERLALALYVPFLATSLFFVLRSGSQLFSWASYYAVFPMRYFGPYVLLWLCIRHLRGLRPRSSVVIFAFAGLVVLNNIEFGLPALLAATTVILVSAKLEMAQALRVIKDLALGLISALAAVTALTLLLTGQLPNLGLLTLYSRIFGEGGFGLLPTPLGGLYLIVDMTFAAAILVAAVRTRRGAADSAHTAALIYSGIFGLGAGDYYMGRTHPAGLVVLFSIWALSVVLLALLALRFLAARPGRLRTPSLLLLAGALVPLGLVSTAVAQFPAPWTQLRRIAASAPPPPPYDISAAVAFLRRTARHDEPVVLLAPLGHVIAFDADVENVSPYSSQEDVVTYGQFSEELTALYKAHGKRIYTVPTYPEITHILTGDGFTATTDPTSGITEWQR